MSVVKDEDRPALFDVMLHSVDYFREEMEKVEAEQPLNEDVDSFLGNINSLIAKIKGEEIPEAAAPKAPAPAAAPAAEAAPAVAQTSEGSAEFPYGLRVFFDEGCGMENLRAFMLVTSVQGFCAEADFAYQPAGVENDSSLSETVIEHGFLLQFRSDADRARAVPVVMTAGSVHSYEEENYVPAPPPAPEHAAPAQEAARSEEHTSELQSQR